MCNFLTAITFEDGSNMFHNHENHSNLKQTKIKVGLLYYYI